MFLLICWGLLTVFRFPEILDLFIEVENMGSIVCVDLQLYTFSSLGLNRADQMIGRFARRSLKLSVFRSWARHWTSALEEVSRQFLGMGGDVTAFKSFHRHGAHFLALFQTCVDSSSFLWCFQPCPTCGPRYNEVHFDNFSLEESLISRMVDVLCDTPFLSFVLTPTAHQALVCVPICHATYP